MGEELDRKCEFAAALKYYYAGKVYYSKLDEFGFQQHGYDSSAITNVFSSNPDGLYVAIFSVLKEVAKNKDWAEKHPGILLGTWAHADANDRADAGDKLQERQELQDQKFEHRQVCHLKDCLSPQGAELCLDVVRSS
jgi:hypothetical protein